MACGWLRLGRAEQAAARGGFARYFADVRGDRRHGAPCHCHRMGREFPNPGTETARNPERRMTPPALIFLAAVTLHFDLTDGRGKKPSGVSIEASEPDADGWYRLTAVSKGKSSYVIVWPVDARAKTPD